MKPSTKAELAIGGMVELARRIPAKPLSLAVLAEKQSISLSYLEQVFAALRRKGLVESVRGPGGGYVLARQATNISAGDIIDALDEFSAPDQGQNTDNVPGDNVTRVFWQVMFQRTLDIYRLVSLQDLVDGSFSQGDTAADSLTQAAE